MDERERFTQASIKTASDLRTVARSSLIRDLTQLTLPEIDAAVDLVAKLVPAGNVPGLILNGLAQVTGRRLGHKVVQQGIRALLQGVEKVLDRAVYATFFAGPAAVIWAYQQLLQLAGKSVEEAFPEGTWQFYTEYALREDTARHTNETHGFDTTLDQHGIRLSKIDRITTWVMACIHCLHDYDRLLENEWRERVYTHLLHLVTSAQPDASHYGRLYSNWLKQLPYGRDQDCSPQETYPQYRRRKFDDFLQEARSHLPLDLRQEWARQVRDAEASDLPAYQQQMSILAYLDPGIHNEARIPIPLTKSHVVLIYQGCYYLIPACAPRSEQPADVNDVRTQIATLLAEKAGAVTTPLASLNQIRRAVWPTLREQLTPSLVEQLDKLRFAPILLNFDPRARHLPLATLRQAERGIGHHALTILDTGESFIFDQSHIFFDGTWGAALAEILSNEALSWAVYLNTVPPALPGKKRPYPLNFPMSDSDKASIQQVPQIRTEATAESDAAEIRSILKLRQILKHRSENLQLTVNDLLILYRAIHALTYHPDPEMVAAIRALAGEKNKHTAAQAALEALDPAHAKNPAVLIPIDASRHCPRDRLYPMSFEVPLCELDLISLHEVVLAKLDVYRQATDDKTTRYHDFDCKRREYLGTLQGFGAVLSRAKEYGIMGESGSVGALRLLAHMPAPLQRMLDGIPGRFDILNDIIKGREVFSNVGAVAPQSSLTRFITAKDDNEKKTLAWGVITDAKGVMRISLRDFRPHVGLLKAAGHQDLADKVAQDYLNRYVIGLNRYIRELQHIAVASQEEYC
jgi:hypothetical protein